MPQTRRKPAPVPVAGEAVVPFTKSAAPPLLLRLPVVHPTWAEDIPPVPNGAVVTVVFSDPDVAAEHVDAVAMLGYTCMGSLGEAGTRPPTLDVLIERATADKHPQWRDALLGASRPEGARVWDLAFGPAAAMLSEAVAVHRRPA